MSAQALHAVALRRRGYLQGVVAAVAPAVVPDDPGGPCHLVGQRAERGLTDGVLTITMKAGPAVMMPGNRDKNWLGHSVAGTKCE